MSTMKDVSRLLNEKTSLDVNGSNAFVTAFFDIIKEALLKDGIVKVRGLGTFKMMTVKQRESVNVNTGERVIIDSHDRISFTPDNAMRDAVNKPFSQFETVVLNEGVTFDDMDLSEEIADEQEQTIEPESTLVAAVAEPESVPVVAVAETEPVPVVAEPDPEPEPTPVVAEPDPEPEPTPEPTPVAEPTPEASTTTAAGFENANTRLERMKIAEEYRRAKKRKFIAILCTSTLLAFIIGFVIGQLLPHFIFNPHRNEIQKAVVIEEPEAKSQLQKPQLQKPQSLNSAAQKAVANQMATEKAEAEKAAKAQITAEQKQAEEAKKAAEAQKVVAAQKAAEDKLADKQLAESKKYETDPRIKYGAYRIVGVAKLIKVKPGETLHSITSRTLGSDMDCYVEALNGKEVKAGQMLKLPKLELKKKKRRK